MSNADFVDDATQILALDSFLAAGNRREEWTPAVAETWIRGSQFRRQAQALAAELGITTETGVWDFPDALPVDIHRHVTRWEPIKDD